MAGPSNNSFIPKRGPVKRKRTKASRRVYVFTIISYILMFATLLAAGGVFLYGNYVEQQRDDEIAALNEEISSFSEGDMQRVLDFDLRLQQATNRLENSVSIVSVFTALEQATIDTVEIENLVLERIDDENFSLIATILTDSFDSTIFQREVFERNEVIEGIDITSIDTSSGPSSDEGGSLASVLTVNAELNIPLSAVPYTVSDAPMQPVTITDPELEAALLGEDEAATGTDATTDAADTATSTNETEL